MSKNLNTSAQDSNDQDITARFEEMSNMTEKMFYDSFQRKHKSSWRDKISREIVFKIVSDIVIFITFTNYVLVGTNELYFYLITHAYISGVLYFKLMFSDPGFIQSDCTKEKINNQYDKLIKIRKLEKQHEEEQARSKENDEFLHIFSDLSESHLYKFAYINMIEDESNEDFRYCSTCGVYRLPRMEHCETQNKCVLRYNHYSQLCKNSIGLCNYNLFIQLLILITCGSAYLIHRNLKIIFLGENFAKIGPVGQLLSSLMLIYCHVILIYSIMALKFHLKLISKNQTYIDILKSSFLFSRYAYIFKEDYPGEKINVFTDPDDILWNIKQMTSLNKSAFSCLLYFIIPICYKTEAITDPLKCTDYFQLNKKSVKNLISLKTVIENKMRERFIAKGLKCPEVNYEKYLAKLT